MILVLTKNVLVGIDRFPICIQRVNSIKYLSLLF